MGDYHIAQTGPFVELTLYSAKDGHHIWSTKFYDTFAAKKITETGHFPEVWHITTKIKQYAVIHYKGKNNVYCTLPL